MKLTEFLEARIAEDEAAANRAGSHNDDGTFANDDYGRLLIQPARVLAECAAKRRIIELHYTWELHAEKATGEFKAIMDVQVSTAKAILMSLALPYADHPDYQEEWKVWDLSLAQGGQTA